MSGRTIKRILSPFEQFVHSESTGGVTLIFASIIAFAWANSPWAPWYLDLREIKFGIGLGGWSLEKPLLLWVNDGLMAFFFYLVGYLQRREVLVGELSEPRGCDARGGRGRGRYGGARIDLRGDQLGRRWYLGLGRADGHGHSLRAWHDGAPR